MHCWFSLAITNEFRKFVGSICSEVANYDLSGLREHIILFQKISTYILVIINCLCVHSSIMSVLRVLMNIYDISLGLEK